MQQSEWVQRNQFEPPVDSTDPAVRLGFISLGMSRFDAFIHSTGEQHSCRFVGPGESSHCLYTNYRRQRVRAHVQSHFSYEPFLCAGACGKPEWCVSTGCSEGIVISRVSSNLAFADNVQLTDHLKRITKPRVQCEVWLV